MPLHLLGKKSWNVYNTDNIARVRRDEAAARAEQAEKERQQHEHEAGARLALLRGEIADRSSAVDDAGSLGTEDIPGSRRKKRRLAGEDDTDRDIRLARPNPHEHGQRGMKLADDAAGRPSHSTPGPAWYMTAPTDQSAPSGPGRDVWGNEDAGRRARDQRRLDANDPLAAMKKGIAQLRRADEQRRAWREQRERDLAGVEPLDDFDLDGAREEERHGEPEASRKIAKVIELVSDLVYSQSQSTGQHVQKHKHKYIGGLVAIAAITVLALGVAYGIYASRKSKPAVCDSAVCLLAVETILSNLHPDVASMLRDLHPNTLPTFPIDPCTNFDQFVCGGFSQHHQFRSEQNYLSTASIMADNVDIILRQLLEKPLDSKTGPDQHLLSVAQDAYKACMDESTLRRIGLDALSGLVDGIRTIFPVYPNQPRPSHQKHLQASGPSQQVAPLADVLIQSILNGASALLDFQVDAPRHQVLFASPVRDIGLPHPDLYDQEDSDLMTIYRQAVKQSLANFYGDSPNTTAVWHKGIHSSVRVPSLSDAVIQFESKIAHLVLESEANSAVSPVYSRLSLADFTNLLPELDLNLVFQGVTNTSQQPDYIKVSSVEYLSHLSVLLQQTQPLTLQAFFVWKTIQQWSGRVDDERLSKLVLLKTRLGGNRTALPEDRWRQCVHDISFDLGWVASRLYVNQGLPSSHNATAADIIDDVKASFYKILTDSTWMPLKDRHTAALKVRHIQAEIAYPTTKPNISNPSAIEDYYRFDNLQLAKDTYLLNGVATTRQQAQRQWAKATGRETDKHEWDLFSTAIDPFYKYTVNTVFVPAALLQPPVLHSTSLPSFLSYGAFGPITGHEISHAFDAVGAQYYLDGTYSNWWGNVTAAEYERKAQCFVTQYSSYTVPGPGGDLHVNGTLTLQEAIADSAGANAAFQAWKGHEQTTKSQALLGLEAFTNEQVFWLSFGNFWCDKVQPEQLEHDVLTSHHAPNSVRILGTVANSRDFLQTWKCPSEEPRCEVW
ncbi:hypothetical protein DV735_g4729, partial [Chaetothyriales sp. CBS 134920]